MKIDPSHPRAASLRIRERLVWGVKKGLTSTAGLLAHGRGEAFDYLLGEKTNYFALKAINAAASYLLLAKKPIISINGNSTALSADAFIKLAGLLHCKIEVNLFHFSRKRQRLIENYINNLSPGIVLMSSKSSNTMIPRVASHRKVVLREGIGNADVVLVPLEDGDRCASLIALGKKVITIDLNPLSRTAQYATVTILDNIARVMPLLIKSVTLLRSKPEKHLKNIVNCYRNSIVMTEALHLIHRRLTKIARTAK